MQAKHIVVFIIGALLCTGGWLQAQQTDHSMHAPQQKEIYTCTMHPEIRSESPGKCPICGMELKPVKAITGTFEPFQEGWTLQELEQIALSKSPLLGIATAQGLVAAGELTQSGMYPNPTIGVQIEELSQRDPEGNKHEHIFVFGEQKILLGGKTGKAEAAAQSGVDLANLTIDARRQQLLAEVRSFYRQLLGSQYRIRVQQQLQRLTAEAASLTQELYNVGQADRPDVLQAEIESHSSEVALAEAQSKHEALWRHMVAVIGDETLPLRNVTGSLDSDLPQLDRNALHGRLLSESPAVLQAEKRIEQKKAQLENQEALGVPDLTLRAGIGYNYEPLENTNKAVGLEGFVEFSFPLPIFNRNQGSVAAAQAEIVAAEHQVRRLKLELDARFAGIFAEYERSQLAVQKYKSELLPRAEEAYNLYKTSFQKMAAAYPQVLIAQRTQYQLQVEYVDALSRLWITAQQLENLLQAEELKMNTD